MTCTTNAADPIREETEATEGAPIRYHLTATTACALTLAVTAPAAQGASVSTLQHRQTRQQAALHRHQGTRTFFRNRPALAHTPAGRRALHVANVWIPILRRELARTKAALHPHRKTVATDACLSALIDRESNWNVHAQNPSTGAYGLPQALPGSKMASAGPDWRDNASTQIRWMLGYVNGRYGGSCNALAFQRAHGWY